MNTPYDLNADVGRMVYVKAIDVDALPQEVQDQAEGLDQLFAVHDAEGQQLALVADRKLAFALARQHDYAPQPLH
ncbi:DUF1150 family protein [Tateyamaria sp. ANG-S1]|mgnify:CR=1 FL=1|uniref:DUF1150 family protein n=1 Tax=Tateyamaria sp. ANG-S1 TaxID=1577905 RepID=UPI00057EA78B|nr:DUF1150 family protein [Tateyamaria sp. ANG-S1]KIC50375.1 hypothetical protein RA29_06585 [Tateyamaria sp. ANG-S1]